MEQSFTITDQLHSLASRLRTPPGVSNQPALAIWSDLICNLHAEHITADDAVTLQALVISLGHSIIENARNPELVQILSNHLIMVADSSGRVLEEVSGVMMNDRRYFDNVSPPSMQ